MLKPDEAIILLQNLSRRVEITPMEREALGLGVKTIGICKDIEKEVAP